jgi:hypothetical protein
MLEPDHHLCESTTGDLTAGTALADREVLTEFAGEVAVRDKDRSIAMQAYNRRLFTEVRAIT